MTGLPEHRIIGNIFEGLTRLDAKTLEPLPAVAERWDISDDKKTYTFHLRKNAKWSNGEPVTAHDFMYSLRRFLDPQTGAEYAYQAWYIKNARRYTQGAKGISPGDPVEVELNERPEGRCQFARTKFSTASSCASTATTKAARSSSTLMARDRKFRTGETATIPRPESSHASKCCSIFAKSAPKRSTITRSKRNSKTRRPTGSSCSPTTPCCRQTKRASKRTARPQWTYAENIVSNGPYRVAFRRIRDRIRLVKNEHYWDPRSREAQRDRRLGGQLAVDDVQPVRHKESRLDHRLAADRAARAHQVRQGERRVRPASPTWALTTTC